MQVSALKNDQTDGVRKKTEGGIIGEGKASNVNFPEKKEKGKIDQNSGGKPMWRRERVKRGQKSRS